jgi:multidrug efflux pump subunit AcrA (membrane-fusion protein)
MLKHLTKILPLVWLCHTPLAGAETQVVREYAINTGVMLGGTVIPYKEVTISAQIPGRINVLVGEEGNRFPKDSVLITVDDTELLAQRRAAVAEMMNADASLRNASVQYSRELWSPNSTAHSMNGMGMPSMFDHFFTKPMGDFMGQNNSLVDRQADLHTYGTQIDQARGALIRAQSQIEQIDSKLRDARGRAPFNGVITKKFVEIGDSVQPGQPLLHFADTEYLQIQLDVPARLVPALSVGMNLSAKLDVLNATVQVRVAQIFPIADPQRHTVTVKCDLPIGTRTGPGQYAQVEIPDLSVAPQNLPVIPRSAILWRGSLPGIYVLNNNKRELRLVRTGKEMDATHVSILSGLKTGEVIELNPPAGISSGWVNQTATPAAR